MTYLKEELEIQLSSSPSLPTTSKFSDLRIDINPSSWLTPYRRTSIGYLTKMLLFYHGIGILIMTLGTVIIEHLVPEYQDASVPLSIISVLSAGPIEEILFFGLPYYIFGNHLVVLGGGLVWVMLHILNTDTFELTTLSYANWLFVIPSLFFSLRTWISGKGWFAILTHSLWNGIFFTLGCLVGEVSCSVTLRGNDILANSNSLWLSAILIVLVFILYKRKPSTKL
ncbi:MAG: CPBP family glutamic-type intramembrane protease [Nitrososphaeraceae archaeon]